MQHINSPFETDIPSFIALPGLNSFIFTYFAIGYLFAIASGEGRRQKLKKNFPVEIFWQLSEMRIFNEILMRFVYGVEFLRIFKRILDFRV